MDNSKEARRVLKDNDASEFNENKSSGGSVIAMETMTETFDMAKAKFERETLYVHGQKLILFREVPEALSKLDIASGVIEKASKFRLLALSGGISPKDVESLTPFIGKAVEFNGGVMAKDTLVNVGMIDLHQLLTIINS